MIATSHRKEERQWRKCTAWISSTRWCSFFVTPLSPSPRDLSSMLYAIIKHLSVSLLKVSFEGFPPLSATLASGVKYNTLPCRSSINPHQDFLSNLTMTLLRVSPAPAPRSILVKKVTFQRREGETSSGSRLEITFRLSIQFFSTVEAALVRVSQAIWTWPV